MNAPSKLCQLGLTVLEIEMQAIHSLMQRIDERFAKACQLILDSSGHVIVLGVGKSGHIASKIAATLASTGTPAFFIHAGDASHGDMGMITANSTILALSKSGHTQELLVLLPLIKRLQVPLITLCSNATSPLAQAATINLDVSVTQEACPLGLAPTASTTAMLAMGDALAIALLEARGFSMDDFALSHPGGQLGRRLLLKTQDLMHQGEQLPCVTLETTLSEALIEMTSKKLGITCIVDESGKLIGIFTDGDLRRSLQQDIDIRQTRMQEVINRTCKTVSPDTLAVDAFNLMENAKITSLAVVNSAHQLLGILHLHDLLQAGVI